MWRLVIETGGESCQVGLMRGEEVVGGWQWDWPRRHAERLIWMAGEVLKSEGIDWPAVEGVAIMVGPGSHTGLRVGLAAAKAWALRWGWKIYPVPLLRVLYEEARHLTGIEKRVLTLWRARSEEAYGHLWQSPSDEVAGEIHPLSVWATWDAAIVVGNVSVGARWLHVSELSWMQVGRASLRLEGVRDPAAIAALVPVYFRPFIPTQRKHDPLGSAPSGR